jgi:hypothetical protein
MRLVRISQCASRRIAVASESTRRLPPETVRSLLFGRLGGGSSEKGGRQRQGPGAAVCVRARAGRRIWQRERPCVRVRVRVRWGRTVAINWSLEIDRHQARSPAGRALRCTRSIGCVAPSGRRVPSYSCRYQG